MLSMSVQSSFTPTLNCPSFQSQKLQQHFPSLASIKTRIHKLHASAAMEGAVAAEAPPQEAAAVVAEEVKMKKAEKPKPELVLKFIWMEKNIGLALDQRIPGHGTAPLSPYFFWPRKDAWEELKATLESKPWISQKKMIILLNQATDIINLWQQSGGNLTS